MVLHAEGAGGHSRILHITDEDTTIHDGSPVLVQIIIWGDLSTLWEEESVLVGLSHRGESQTHSNDTPPAHDAEDFFGCISFAQSYLFFVPRRSRRISQRTVHRQGLPHRAAHVPPHHV